MLRLAKHVLTLAFALSVVAFAGVLSASAQSGDGWTVLLDGKDTSGWDQVGETNWRSEDGAIVADKLTSKGAAHLVSKDKYKDFVLHVEFWASDDANSGIYIRCQDAKNITDKSCYEANIFDQRKDPTYGTGGIVHFVEVKPIRKSGGKWNTYEITAKGRDITVVLNGEKTAELRNGLFAEGPITLQHGAGTIKFRKVAIKPL
ncbi:MAG TPA: DUF1080 domain-containing protein [Xanthobacteraceae bacterium]|nr:DUF1080 domain-containing protein [Xanthobacteraceae bacterium]